MYVDDRYNYKQHSSPSNLCHVLRWAIVLAMLIMVLLGLAIFLCLRKRNRAIRQNSRIEEEEKPKTKDVEQSYSLVEERWKKCVFLPSNICRLAYQQWPNIFYQNIVEIKKKQMQPDWLSFWHRQPLFILMNYGAPFYDRVDLQSALCIKNHLATSAKMATRKSFTGESWAHSIVDRQSTRRRKNKHGPIIILCPYERSKGKKID